MTVLLTDLAVVEIRTAAVAGATSYDLADRFGVDPAYIRRIVRGEVRPYAGGPTRNLRIGPRANPPVRGVASFEFIDELPDLVARAAEREQPITFPESALPSDPCERASVIGLMETLGVRIDEAA